MSKITKGEQRFNAIKERYEKAFEKKNGHKIHNFEYKGGYVIAEATEYSNIMSGCRFRIGEIEEALKRLEKV